MNSNAAIAAANAASRPFSAPDPSLLVACELAVAGLPLLRQAVVQFLQINNAGSAQQIDGVINSRLGEFVATVGLAHSGTTKLALDIVKVGAERDRMTKFRQLIDTELSSAARRQSSARLSVYDALAVIHAAVIVLTVGSFLALYVFTRQLRLTGAQKMATQGTFEHAVQKRTQELRELAQYLQTVKNAEKDHLARGLHDHFSELSTVVKLDLEGLRKRVESDPNLTAHSPLNLATNKMIVMKRRMIEDMRQSSPSMLALC